MIVNLENLEGLPIKYWSKLKKFDCIFKTAMFLEDYSENENINSLIFEINNYCLENRVIGFHYTNAIEGYIIEKGMILRSGEQIRSDFIKSFFHLFDQNEQQYIKEKWLNRFGKTDTENRNNRIYFNFTRAALNNGDAELLLKYYGGEQVYFPIYELQSVGKKLREIGRPIILKCDLDPNKINTFIKNPWGKIIVSSYNRIINPDAHVVDQDGSQAYVVQKEHIEIIRAEDLIINSHLLYFQ